MNIDLPIIDVSGTGHAPAAPPNTIPVPIPAKVLETFFDARGRWRPSFYKVLWGGRGGGKSEGVVRILIGLARQSKTRILCTRMFQSSIGDSVHKTIHEAIISMGIEDEFEVLKYTIVHRRTGSDFIFKGLQRDIGGIKSLKGVKYCWVEEAESVTRDIWQVLEPTFRVEGSEIWLTYNPDLDSGATHQMFNVHPQRGSIVQEVQWSDNPFFPGVLNDRRLAMKADADAGDLVAAAAYEWIWEGKCRRITDAVIFRNRVVVEDFDQHSGVRVHFGADWGFADDPTTLIRFYMHDDALWITHEMFAWRTELDDIPAKFDEVPDARNWPIKGDAAQPMIISYLKRARFNITAAEKWPGSIEDGIAHMQAFKRIVIHPRCKHIAQEFRLYSWKTDPRQLDDKGNPVILPIIVDKYNHGIDAVRYGLDGYIQGKGGLRISSKAMSWANGR